jgi:hypothetical protein
MTVKWKPEEFMPIAIDIPDSIERAIAPEQYPSRAALEALALEGYRSGRLGESAARRLLGFDSRMDIHAFLKDCGVDLNYWLRDLEHDLREAGRIVARVKASDAAGLQRTE